MNRKTHQYLDGWTVGRGATELVFFANSTSKLSGLKKKIIEKEEKKKEKKKNRVVRSWFSMLYDMRDDSSNAKCQLATFIDIKK